MAQVAAGVSPGAGEQAVLAALRSLVARAGQVVNSTKQQAEVLAPQVHAPD
jgi:hypothetical protein